MSAGWKLAKLAPSVLMVPFQSVRQVPAAVARGRGQVCGGGYSEEQSARRVAQDGFRDHQDPEVSR